MNRFWIFMILIACPIVALGQSNGAKSSAVAQGNGAGAHSWRHHINGYDGGDWDWWSGGSAQTPEGAALQGAAQVIRAAGDYNQATSAAAVNATQAESNAMRNQVQSVQTFYDMRKLAAMSAKGCAVRMPRRKNLPAEPMLQPPAL